MKKEKTTLTNYFFIFLLSSVSLIFSQQKTFAIDWDNPIELTTEFSKTIVPHFNKENFSFSYDKGLTFFAQWNESAYLNESSVSIDNIIYSPITQSDLKDLDVSTIPKTIQYKLNNATARGVNYAYLELSPIVKIADQYNKVTSFTVNYSQGRSSISNRNPQTITNSILASGDWKRFYIDKSGVFKVTRSFLNQIGFNTNVDPRTIKIYGNGGRMMPQLNSEPFPFDPEENAIEFVGEQDGVFNNDDYILFYGEGPFEYSEDSDTNVNIFTEKTFYFITSSPGFGKRIQAANQPIGNPDLIIDSFQDYKFHEVDEENLGAIGRKWFGEEFRIVNNQTFDFDFPNIDTSIPISININVGAVTAVSNTFISASLNGDNIASLPSNNSFGIVEDADIASGANYQGEHIVNSSTVTIGLDYNNSGSPAANAYLNYINIEATRGLAYAQNQFRFKNKEVINTSGIVEYRITNAAQVSEVWDVTDKKNVTNIINLDGASDFNFKANAGEQRLYIAVDPSDYYVPIKDSNSNVANQNIKGTIFQNSQGQFQDVDYIIVTRSDMLSQANRLAQINRDRYSLNVKVLDLKDIYTEFNNGNADIAAIRNLVKYVYDNASSPENRIKYLCLFGDGSYDYKDRIANNTNVVPSWNATNSFNLTNSFVSDDFYGMMDQNEGSMISSDKLDIAVGRILADTPQRARELVDKVEAYYGQEALGSWRNNFIAISDDVDVDWERILQQTTDDIANLVADQKQFVNSIKVHSDSYQQQASSAGERYPEVNEYIKDKIDVGALVVNYFGHGGEDGIARERIFDKNNAQEVRNVCKLNCFVTVTCEYTKFDNPNRETAGEFTYWNKDAGAIALLTTTRQIFVNVGVGFNVILTDNLFSLSLNEQVSIAEALRLTKNNPQLAFLQRRLVFFIGDPAMKLTMPKPGVRLTKINDVDINQSTEVLKALDYAKLSGEIVDDSGNVVTNFNGTLTANVFDKNIQRQTLGNNGITFNGQLIILDFETLGEAIFRGQASVENGQFEFDFIVPRDIAIPVANGRVSFYAQTENSQIDYAGASTEIQIGGINENAAEDNIGPNITLFMNDESFVSGGITNEQPTLLAKLNDEHGINTSSGIGHDIVAILDGNETEPFILNDYYEAEVDDYQNGTVNFQFRDLESGLHTISFKAWDVYNNSSTTEIQFLVKDKDEGLVINNVLNYPNPFVDYTEFWFNHNSSDVLDISVQIFTVSGKIVRTLNGQTNNGSKNPSSLSRDIVWDGRDDFGDKIGKGVYIYKLKVRSNQLNKQVEKIEKLVIL